MSRGVVERTEKRQKGSRKGTGPAKRKGKTGLRKEGVDLSEK